MGWKIPWRRKWQPTPVFLPGQRSLVGYSVWDHKEVEYESAPIQLLLLQEAEIKDISVTSVFTMQLSKPYRET